MSDENECTWIALEAANRNVVALLCIRKEKCEAEAPPVCCGPVGRITAGLELRTATATGGSVKSGAAAVSATVSRASADSKEDAPAVGLGGESADALTSGEGNFADGDKWVKRA